jgi:hypothetical protein
VAKRLGVRQVTKPFILVVGGQPWVIDIARVLRESGVAVMMAAATQDERDQIKQAGLELAPRGALAEALIGGSELPDVLQKMTGVLLLTAEDGFNGLGSIVLAAHPRLPVYRLAPNRGGYGDVGQHDTADVLFPQLTQDKITQRYQSGSRVTAAKAANGAPPAGTDLLFLIDREGHLRPVTTPSAPTPKPDDTVVVLEPAVRN